MLANALTPPTAATPPPVSVVIPSYARAHNLPTGLCSLLKYGPLRRAGSEVVVAHGSARSLNASASIDAAVDRCAGAGASSSRLRHLDLVAHCAAAKDAAPGLSVRSLGQTLDGREMDCVSVGTGPLQAWVIHRQHPGESMAEFFAEGLLGRLLILLIRLRLFLLLAVLSRQ